MAGHEDAGVVAGHIGTNTPKFAPPRRGRPRFDPTQTGLCTFGWIWSAPILYSEKIKSVRCQMMEAFVYVPFSFLILGSGIDLTLLIIDTSHFVSTEFE